MFCARCGEQIPDANEICPLCRQEANIKTPAAAQVFAPPSQAAAIYADSVPLTAIGRELQGVGGWLLFFCFGLVFLRPTVLVWQIISARDMVSAVLHMVPDLVRVIAGITVGIYVWHVHPLALRILRVYLCVIGALGALGVMWFALSDSITSGEDMFSSVRSLGFVVIWFFYFHNSVRVRATFGRNL